MGSPHGRPSLPAALKKSLRSPERAHPLRSRRQRSVLQTSSEGPSNVQCPPISIPSASYSYSASRYSYSYSIRWLVAPSRSRPLRLLIMRQKIETHQKEKTKPKRTGIFLVSSASYSYPASRYSYSYSTRWLVAPSRSRPLRILILRQKIGGETRLHPRISSTGFRSSTPVSFRSSP